MPLLLLGSVILILRDGHLGPPCNGYVFHLLLWPIMLGLLGLLGLGDLRMMRFWNNRLRLLSCSCVPLRLDCFHGGPIELLVLDILGVTLKD